VQRLSLGATSLTVIAADVDLLDACVAEGLATENPNLH